ncbi:hypothetical protein VP01_3046g3 [Puccinia sorghi]|uniref:Uncharacterized protein n=1 Tax=Puccinia sorghi TaxID=27349 RepID=A0A0L6UZX0_9BASI|nr:hypothetical protein VP01_3046g3 [Puccinia sorghi]
MVELGATAVERVPQLRNGGGVAMKIIIIRSLTTDQSDVFQIYAESRKRLASEEREPAARESEASVLSAGTAPNDEGLVAAKKRARPEVEAENLMKEEMTRKSLGKPFRNPMIGSANIKNPPRQQNQSLLIKQLQMELVRLQDGERIVQDCMIEKVHKATEKEAAEYLWNLVGKEQSIVEPKYQPFESRRSWGYDTEDYSGKKDSDANNDQGPSEISWDSSSFDAPEELPTASEIIGESTATRHYNANGLADLSSSRLPLQPSTSNLEDSHFLSPQKPARDVGWMMEQMGLDASIFGWNTDEGKWIS